MPTKPLQPFTPPTALLHRLHLPSNISSGTLVIWILLFVFVIWALYTFIAVYHWLKYSHASRIAFPAIAVHLGISFLLMVYILSGNL